MVGIAFDNVTKQFGSGAPAVDALTLRVDDGEFMVLVGPSGSGKTTALRMIAGLESVSAGTIRIGDRVMNDVPPSKRDISMVFQSYALYPHMTVAQNLAFSLRIRHVPKPEQRERVLQVAKILGLDELLERRPAALSGGQRQRVAMGRAMIRQPQAFLMDEPLSNLDAKLRVGMRAELKRLHERLAVTTVYVTHDQVEAMTLGDRVAVMHQGRLQQVAPPGALYAEPENLFVATFIGSPSMNVADANIVSTESGGLAVAFAKHLVPLPDELVAKRTTLTDLVGQPVLLGIRPTGFEVASDSDRSRPSMKVRVDVTEEFGSGTHVIFRLDKTLPSGPADVAMSVGSQDRLPAEDDNTLVVDDRNTWTASVNASARIRPGDLVDLAVDMSACHFFDPSSGLTLR